MGALSPVHWAIIVLLVILLFGAKRLPDAARGVGKSLRIFKAETKGLRDDDHAEATATPAQQATAQQIAAQQMVAQRELAHPAVHHDAPAAAPPEQPARTDRTA